MQIYMGNSSKNVDFVTKIEGFDYLRKEKYIKTGIDRTQWRRKQMLLPMRKY